MAYDPADRQLIRSLNRSTVLNVIREQGPISKAEIARATGLSQATVGSITKVLIDRALVVESEPTASGVGRPPTLIQLDRDSYNVIGLKLMPDLIVGAITDLEAHTIGQAEVETGELAPEAVLDKAGIVVERLLEEAGLDRSRILGAGIGIGGVVDAVHGICISSMFLGWDHVPIAALAEERFGVAVRVDNDVNTLALAERWFGVGQKVDDFLLVTLGRGVGLSVVTGGRVYRGSNGGAGEFGHTLTGLSRESCTCGNVGCLEASIAEPSLLRRAHALSREMGFASPAHPADLYRMASEVPAVADLLRQAGTELGLAIGNLINLLAPELVILSGEGVEAGDMLLESARAEMSRHVHHGLRDSYQLVVEPLRDEAWARGAASLILDAIFDPPNNPHQGPMWDWDRSQGFDDRPTKTTRRN